MQFNNQHSRTFHINTISGISSFGTFSNMLAHFITGQCKWWSGSLQFRPTRRDGSECDYVHGVGQKLILIGDLSGGPQSGFGVTRRHIAGLVNPGRSLPEGTRWPLSSRSLRSVRRESGRLRRLRLLRQGVEPGNRRVPAHSRWSY